MANSESTPTQEGLFSGYEREQGPLGAYTGMVGFFNLLFAIFLLVAKAMDRPIPDRIRFSDILLFGAATQKLSWLLATDVVTSPLRAPFTEFEEMKSPANVSEKPRGEGFRRAMGELLTCQFCIGQWIAAFFAYGLVLAPAVTRLVGGIFAMLAVADFLHQAYQKSV